MFNLIAVILFSLFVNDTKGGTLNTTIIKNLNYSSPFTASVNNTVEYILQFSNGFETIPPRVTVTSKNATVEAPLMIVAAQPKNLLSWSLPLLVETTRGVEYYMKTSRTLCLDILKSIKKSRYESENPIVTISSASEVDVDFTILLDSESEFHLHHSVEYNFVISPSEPRYFFYNFSTNLTDELSNYDTVILEVQSEDSVCTIVSIQNISCPVFDLNQDITFRGFYETFDFKGGITIPKNKFPYGFYIAFVAKPDDFECTRDPKKTTTDRTKKISLIIKPSINYNDYVLAVTWTLGSIGAFYVVFGIAFFLCSKHYYLPRQVDLAVHAEVASVNSSTNTNEESQSIDEVDYDTIEDLPSEREMRLCRTQPYLNDLATRHPKVLAKKSYLYLYNVLTVALFYGLPVVQLVVTYQRVLNETGQQDLCYYNFLCSHPLGFLSDFNHVFSNIGYVLLGFLFLIITYRRELWHNNIYFNRHCGIPQHYGLFYAMGVALIMEGVLSGSYHVCPSQTNFQFDTSFMYVMAVLCMVKLYQNRHPDINANAYTTFGVLAIAILLGMIGILEGTKGFWIFFVVIYILSCFYLSVKVYYMGCWRLNKMSLMRIVHIVRHDFWSGPLNVLKPCYQVRFCVLFLGNMCNWSLAFVALHYNLKNFAVFLLLVFMSNTLLYFFFYIVMKYVNRERVKFISWIFLIISILCAISALYFFLHRTISWSATPAQSRQFNTECKWLRFYDDHDIWHFLSAIGMFFTFMVLLTLDDDISHTHHSQITVF